MSADIIRRTKPGRKHALVFADGVKHSCDRCCTKLFVKVRGQDSYTCDTPGCFQFWSTKGMTIVPEISPRRPRRATTEGTMGGS